MDIGKYVKEYKFDQIFYNERVSLSERQTVKKYLQKHEEENFSNLSRDFWKNPNSSVAKLKQKYKINSSIAYSDILKAYPTEEYVRFLKMIYSAEASLEELIKKFAISSNRIEEIIIPIIIDNYSGYCPKCYSNCFDIKLDIYDLENGGYRLECDKCQKTSKPNELMMEDEVEKRIRGLAEATKKFESQTTKIQGILSEIKCPRCQEELILKLNKKRLTYSVNCSRCKYSSSDVEVTITEYKQWKQRAVMMIAIKAKEQELIEEALRTKKLEEIYFKKEDIINIQENYEAFDSACKVSSMDQLQAWGIIFSEIKKCNRLEQKLLIIILELAKEKNKKIVLGRGQDEEAVLYEYISSQPIVSELINKTKIVVVRQILRNLIKRKLVIVDEVAGKLYVLPVLVDNLESIESLTKLQNINGHIKYMIFEKQDFTCMTCGSKGRELKIAYLTSDRNIDKLSNLIAVCDNCFEMVTRNEILIDGTITFDIDGLDSDVSKSWKFTVKYLPEIKNNKYAFDSIKKMENEFEIVDVINALALSIYKLKHNELTEGTLDNLIRYANGVLRTAVKTGNEVKIFKNISKEFEVEKWLSDNI